MKKHLIPLLILLLLLLAVSLLAIGALMLYELSDGVDRMAGTVLILAAWALWLYGPAAALLISLQRKDRIVPQAYAWLGVISFAVALIGVGVTTVGYYGFFLEEIEPWMLFFWAVSGLLLPFFVSSVVHLQGRAPAERRQATGKVMVALLVLISAVLLIGSGLYLHRMSAPHLLNRAREWAMYERFQRLIVDDDPWETVDRVTDAAGAEERELTGEERAAAVRLCRELVRPLVHKDEKDTCYFAWVLPDQKAHYLKVSMDGDMTVDGETYNVLQCSMTEYCGIGAEEMQVVYTQGDKEHTVTLFWSSDPEE